MPVGRYSLSPDFYALMAYANVVPKMKAIAEAARWHHERFDGIGYPDHLIGDQIPLLTMIGKFKLRNKSGISMENMENIALKNTGNGTYFP